MVVLAFIAGALIMLSGIYFGLKWQVQIEKNEPITLPVIPKKDVIKEEPTLSPQLVKEWFEGEQKEGE